jgi:hypothetical protein
MFRNIVEICLNWESFFSDVSCISMIFFILFTLTITLITNYEALEESTHQFSFYITDNTKGWFRLMVFNAT